MAETKAELEQRVAVLTATVAEQAATIKELEELNATINAELNEVAAKSAATSVALTIEVGKETFEITAPSFSFEGEVYKASDLAENPKLAAKLVKLGAGVLNKIV